MRVTIRRITDRKQPFDFDRYSAELHAELDTYVRPRLQEQFEAAVSDWTHKPSFGTRFVITSTYMAVEVFAQGPNKMIWIYVDSGTRPHTIEPTGPWPLKFRGRYSARTRPGGRAHAGSGKSSGPVVHAMSVEHPGNDARDFTGTIIKKFKPEFYRRVHNALRRATETK